MDNPPLISGNPTLLREAMARRLYRRSAVSGQIALPAVPGMIDEYVTMCDNIFAAVGRGFTAEQLADAKTVLEGQLAEAYAVSPRSNIVITFNATVGTVLNYHIKPEWWTVEGAYENWIATREPPLFGTEPDARVWALANEAADPTTHPVLDIGAGTGRNALALARRGHPVDVVVINALPPWLLLCRRSDDGSPSAVPRGSRTIYGGLSRFCSPRWCPTSGQPSTFAVCSNSPPTALRRLGTWCSTPSGAPGLHRRRCARTGTAGVHKHVTWQEMSTAAAGLRLEPVADDPRTESERTCPTVPAAHGLVR
jgi:hypothetical protein